MIITFVATMCLNSQWGLAIGVAVSIPVFFLSTYGRAMVFSFRVRPHFVRALTPRLDVVVIPANRFFRVKTPARRRLPEYLVTCRGVEARNRHLWVVLNGQDFPDRFLSAKETKRLCGLVRDVQGLQLAYKDERALVLVVGLKWMEGESWSPLLDQEGVICCESLDEVLERARMREKDEEPAAFSSVPSMFGHTYSFSHMRAPQVPRQTQDVLESLDGEEEGAGIT